MRAKLYSYFRKVLNKEIRQILLQNHIPSREVFQEAIQSYRYQEELLKAQLKKESLVEQRARVAHIHVEKKTCIKCNRPAFQGGLCLLHFQVRYSGNSVIG